MTLRRKMGLQIAATIVGLLMMIVASLWGLNGLRQDYGLALKGYGELRNVFEAGSHLATARALLQPPASDRGRALMQVQTAADLFEAPPAAGSDSSTTLSLTKVSTVRAALAQASAQLSTPAADGPSSADVTAVGQALGRVGDLAAEIRQRVQASQDAAQAKRQTTVAAIAVVSAVVVLGAVLLGIWQYRGIVLPLARLHQGVHRVARGRFSQRVEVRGNDEIASLAGDFNRMAAELDGFYRDLERKVAEKSRDLVRSERLASVGYLAAGVAHEINNPLGIISGYAELSLEQLKQSAGGPDGNGELVKALGVICDEAFRCKEITGKLLSLSRGADEARTRVNLADIVRQVVQMVGGLRDHRGRRISIHGERPDLMVLANEAEMKQVTLNLLVNALEASPADGEVGIELTADEKLVRMAVIDTGKGMSPETSQRVFEPFFTEKKEDERGGIGLGLSITHAIIESHGGRIRAASDGPGQGSRFEVELPVASAAGAAL
jgi:two-component system, NtrC family, sensor kinase